MTPRERVLAAINHKEPDYIPLDLGGTPSSGISAIAYNNLKKELGMTTGHTRIFDVVQQVVYPETEIMDRFGVDVIDIGRVFNEKDDDWYDVELADGSIGQYPKWFKPKKLENGDYRMTGQTLTTRWAKSSGALSCTVRGIMREKRTSIRNSGSVHLRFGRRQTGH